MTFSIRYLKQPEKSRQCGQYCLAMLSNHTIDEIVNMMDAKKGTTTKDIIKGLNQMGFKNSERLIPRRKQTPPDLAICKVRREWNKSGGWHWVVLFKGKVYDPDPVSDHHAIMSLEAYDKFNATRNQKISSYIAIDY